VVAKEKPLQVPSVTDPSPWTRAISGRRIHPEPKTKRKKKKRFVPCLVKQEMLLRERLLRERRSKESGKSQGPNVGSEEQRANLLRERLLREKIKLLRRMSAGKDDVYPLPDMSG